MSWNRFAALPALGLALLALTPVHAAASAGDGCMRDLGAVPPATGPEGTPGGFDSIATCQQVSTDGGTVAATAGSTAISVVVPAQAFGTGFPDPRAVVTAADLTGLDAGLARAGYAHYRALAGVGVKLYFISADLSSYTEPLKLPVTLHLTSPAFTAGDTVVEFTSSTHAVRVPATISGHTVTIAVTHDPNLAVLKAPAAAHRPVTAPTAAAPQPTLPMTGRPLTAELTLAAALIAAGQLLRAAGQRRVQPTAKA